MVKISINATENSLGTSEITPSIDGLLKGLLGKTTYGDMITISEISDDMKAQAMQILRDKNLSHVTIESNGWSSSEGRYYTYSIPELPLIPAVANSPEQAWILFLETLENIR